MANKVKKQRVSMFSAKTDGLLNYADLKKTSYKAIYWSLMAFMIIISTIVIVPCFWVITSAFKTAQEIYAIPPVWLPAKPSWETIPFVLSKMNFGVAFINSLWIIIGCLVCDITFNGITGFVLAKVKPVGSHIFETIIFSSMLLPGMSMLPVYLFFLDVPILHISLVGSFIPIWLMAGVSSWNIMLFRNFFNGIPTSYIEAAKIDGCSEVGIFMRIILPLSRPIIAVISLFSVLGSWGNFMWPYLLLSGTGKEPVAVMIFRAGIGSANLRTNEYLMLLMIASIPTMIAFIFFSKQIVGGFTMTGLKG